MNFFNSFLGRALFIVFALVMLAVVISINGPVM